jgi:hypothetical protein
MEPTSVLDRLLGRFAETFLGKGVAVYFLVFLLVTFLTTFGTYFLAPASEAKNGAVAVAVTGVSVFGAFYLGYLKRSDRQFYYGWIEVLGGTIWSGIQIAYFLNDTSGQPIFLSRALGFIAGIYLLRRGVDNILEGDEKLKKKGLPS